MMPTDRIQINLPSALYPFRTKDLPRLEFGSYTLQNVFQSITEEQRRACVELWLRNRVIPTEQAALQRSNQVCYFITDSASGQCVGVNTLYRDRLVANGPEFFFNRMFIDPDYRNSRLMITGTAMMLCYAKTRLAGLGVEGVININENTKLSRPGMNKIFTRLGYRSIGQQNGKEVLYFEFSRIHYTES